MISHFLGNTCVLPHKPHAFATGHDCAFITPLIILLSNKSFLCCFHAHTHTHTHTHKQTCTYTHEVIRVSAAAVN